MKDSSGDGANLEAIMKAFPAFAMFAGNEPLLLANMRFGGVGCISATANVNPAAIVGLFDSWENDDADAVQKGLNAVRGAVQQFPLIPAMKMMISHFRGDAEWNRLRPPLVELGEADANKLIADLDALDFEMPRLGD
jgi:4-hydroxy-tetrahydrodipicolinate synthase